MLACRNALWTPGPCAHTYVWLFLSPGITLSQGYLLLVLFAGVHLCSSSCFRGALRTELPFALPHPLMSVPLTLPTSLSAPSQGVAALQVLGDHTLTGAAGLGEGTLGLVFTGKLASYRDSH